MKTFLSSSSSWSSGALAAKTLGRQIMAVAVVESEEAGRLSATDNWEVGKPAIIHTVPWKGCRLLRTLGPLVQGKTGSN